MEQAEFDCGMTLKCKSCIHYYRTMVTREGYNPSPYCHLYEDTGQRPNVLTQECFEKCGQTDGQSTSSPGNNGKTGAKKSYAPVSFLY